MKKINIMFALLPALLLSACTTVEPIFKDTSSRTGSCIDGGPDSVARKFYDLRIKQSTHKDGNALDNIKINQFRPYLSDVLYQEIVKMRSQKAANLRTRMTDNKSNIIIEDIFSNRYQGITDVDVASIPTIPGTDAKHIPLRVGLTYQKANGGKVSWQDEVLMIREGNCWVVDDIRFIGSSASASTLRQILEKNSM